jgi:hypothetical protein
LIAAGARRSREHSGGGPRLIFQLQDITDRKPAEQQLHHDASRVVPRGLSTARTSSTASSSRSRLSLNPG